LHARVVADADADAAVPTVPSAGVFPAVNND
jgi:hypothetical protein